MTVSDLMSQQLVEELAAPGIQVPGELAVIGFNNQLGSVRSFPLLTTIDPHFFQIGCQTVVILLSAIRGSRLCKSLLIPCCLIVSQSCGCFEDLITRAEIKQFTGTDKGSFDSLIKEHYEEIITRLTNSICKFDAGSRLPGQGNCSTVSAATS